MSWNYIFHLRVLKCIIYERYHWVGGCGKLSLSDRQTKKGWVHSLLSYLFIVFITHLTKKNKKICRSDSPSQLLYHFLSVEDKFGDVYPDRENFEITSFSRHWSTEVAGRWAVLVVVPVVDAETLTTCSWYCKRKISDRTLGSWGRTSGAKKNVLW